MKKVLSLILVLALCLSVIAVAPVSAAGVSVTPDKAAYTPTEEMKITVTGFTAEMEDANAFVSVTRKNARPNDYGNYKYADNLYETNGVWTVDAPYDVGEYEIRFYKEDGNYTNEAIIAMTTFKVNYINNEVIEIKQDKPQYTPNEEMKITVTGFTEAMENVNAFVSVTRKNARPEDYGNYKYARELYETNGVWTVNAPSEVGDYEIRFYAKDGEYNNDSIVCKVPLTVTYSTIVTSVTPDRSAVRPNDTVKITVTGVTEAQKSVNAFVSIAKKNDRPENYGTYKYVKDLDITFGVWTAETPSEPGEYEIRLYAKDGEYTNESIIARADLVVSGDAAAAPVYNEIGTLPIYSDSGKIPEITNPIYTAVVAFMGEAIEVGVKLSWAQADGGVGYRIYRSEDPDEDGISITDFYLTSTTFIDVNVQAEKTYYYSIRQVLAEAKPFDGLPEELGPVTSTIQITTSAALLGGDLQPPVPGAVKKFILMKLDDPKMTVDGIDQEVDPGRGTAPVLLNGRTLVPIRAIVEGMGGEVGWDADNNEISLKYRTQNVLMWLDQLTIKVNGEDKEIDVAPTTINDRTMVPIRFAAENLGCVVEWLNSTEEIVIVFY